VKHANPRAWRVIAASVLCTYAISACTPAKPQPTAAALAPPAVAASAVPTLQPTPTATPTTIALPIVQRPIVNYGYDIVATYPHDRAAFTQGLLVHEGRFFESTGLKGRSSVREVDIATGNVLRKQDVPSQYFAEGLALVNGELLQLTWQEHVGFVYDLATFTQKRTWAYSTEGWGIAYDGASLVMSDGSPVLQFLDPQTLAPIRTVTVTRDGAPVPLLNELEWIDGTLWANIWQTAQIVQIDPQSGQVIGQLNLTGLLPLLDASQPFDVLNGIAYDPLQKRMFVTGKLWPSLFEIRLKQP
jgi:glutaminyl-peptide cyclotransferase